MRWLVLIAIVLLAGCASPRVIHTPETITERDTIVYYQTIIDTVTITATDTITINDNGQLTTPPVTVENDYSKAVAGVFQNRIWLNMYSKVDSLPVKTKIIFKDKEVIHYVDVEKPIPWYVWAVIASLVLISGLLILKR